MCIRVRINPKFAKAATTELFKCERTEKNIQYYRPITQTLKQNIHTHHSQLIEKSLESKTSLKQEHENEQFVCHTQLRCIETTMGNRHTDGWHTHQSVYEQK